MKTFLAVAALSLGLAQAADLRIYPSFTEVREPVMSSGTTLSVALPQEAWAGVIPGSLDLEGLAFDSAVQRLDPNWLSSLEGKTVYLRRRSDSGPAQVEPVTLIRARDLLVRDAQGRYFNVNYEDLQFDVPPPVNPLSPSQALVFSLPRAGSGTLSYLTRSVTWAPRYTLKASAAGANLTGLADIRNGGALPYEVKNTELYAGDVNVQAVTTSLTAADAVMESRAFAAPAPAPKIEGGGELRGLYKYTLSTAFTLPANSVVTLPFVTPKLTLFERFASLNTYFSPGPREGTLDRAYRLKADDRLPAGPVTVREDGRIVGQTRIDETRRGGEIEFTVGDDPDVAYARTVETVSQSKNADGKVVRTRYKVTYNFENSKARAIRAEVTERVGGRRVAIDTAAPTQNEGRAVLKVDLPAGGKVSRSFTVVVDNS